MGATRSANTMPNTRHFLKIKLILRHVGVLNKIIFMHYFLLEMVNRPWRKELNIYQRKTYVKSWKLTLKTPS